MKLIPLTRGFFTKVDDADFDWLNQWKWCACPAPHTVYAIRVERQAAGEIKKTVLMHREIAGVLGLKIDHWDGDGLNNQRANLRPANNSQNSSNRQKLSGYSSKFKGVSWNSQKRKWKAGLRIWGTAIFLGYHDVEEAAARAYDAAARCHFGKFARLNFP